MWHVNGTLISRSWLNLEPVKILYEFDGPKIFTCRDSAENDYLAYQCGEEAQVMRFLVVPFTDDLERSLIIGDINLRDALLRPRGWLFDLSYQWQVLNCWRIDVDALPSNILPRPGVMLWSHLRPRIVRDIHLPGATRTDLVVSIGNAPGFSSQLVGVA